VRKAVFNGEERQRLYKEAKSFMKLRSARNKAPKPIVLQNRPRGKDPQS